MPLRAGATCATECRALLSRDERLRADRYHRNVDRDRFTVSRGALRKILGALLNAPAADLRFCYSRTGRPALEKPWHSDELGFNLSHSHQLTLVAISAGQSVGVDVEHTANNHPLLELAQRFFSPVEVRALTNLPEPARGAAFYRCWTRKEAYLKGIGTGLSKSLESFDVTLGEDEKARLLADRDDPQAPERWSLEELQVPDCYRAAVAVAAPIIRCRYHDFHPCSILDR